MRLEFWGLALVLAYLVDRVRRIRAVKFKRSQDVEERFAYLQDDLSKMTYHEAEEILKVSQFFEMPWIIALSLSFALFKTYAIPSISAVLCKTRELATPGRAARRAEDTAVFLGELALGGLDTERGTTVISRINWLHSRYGNLITRDDMLYTLSTFIFQPIEFIRRWEWRQLSELEQEARYVYWREVGARMGIAAIPPTRAELWQWQVQYARKAYAYAPQNETVGDATIEVLLQHCPSLLRPLGKQAALAFLPTDVREAFGYPAASHAVVWAMNTMLLAKGFVCGWLLFPRDAMPDIIGVNEVKDEQGSRFQRKAFVFEPWYVASDNVAARGLLGFAAPGKQWHDEGYRTEKLGPERLTNQGVEKTLKGAKEMREKAAVCPFFQAQLAQMAAAAK